MTDKDYQISVNRSFGSCSILVSKEIQMKQEDIAFTLLDLHL